MKRIPGVAATSGRGPNGYRRDDLEMLRPAARDDDLHEDIDHTMPVLERQLTRARELDAQLGVTTDTSRTSKTPPRL